MDIDIERIFGAVRREVSSRQHEGKTARVANVSREFATTVEDLWDAVTNPERIPRWFMPVSGDLRLGGQYAIEGNASGTITACEPPSHFAATWEYGGEVSWITVALVATDGGKAHLTLEHIAYVDDDRWQQFGPGAVGVGWDLTLIGLDRHLAGGSIDATSFEEWTLSEEGKRFVGLCSDDWARASIADGTPKEEAEAAAAMTTGFYTGTLEFPMDCQDDPQA